MTFIAIFLVYFSLPIITYGVFLIVYGEINPDGFALGEFPTKNETYIYLKKELENLCKLLGIKSPKLEAYKKFNSGYYCSLRRKIVIGLNVNYFPNNVGQFLPIQLDTKQKIFQFILFHEFAHYLQDLRNPILFEALANQENAEHSALQWINKNQYERDKIYRTYHLEAEADSLAIELMKQLGRI